MTDRQPGGTASESSSGSVAAAFSLGRGLGPCQCPNCKADPQYAAKVRERERGGQ